MKLGVSGKTVLLLMMLVSLLAVGLVGEASAKAEFIMKVASEPPPVQACGRFGFMLKENMAKATKGRVEVQYFPGCQLGACIEIANKTSMGVIQACMAGTPGTASLGKGAIRLTMMTLPYMFKDRETFEKFLASDLVEEMYHALDHLNVLTVGFTDYGYASLFTNKPIDKLSELKGVKLRVPESYIQKAITTAMGASPTVIPFTETYEALRRGIVDGIDQAWSTLWKAKLYQATPYVTETNHWFGTFTVMISKRWLNKLPKDLRATVIQVTKDTCKQARLASAKENAAARAALAKAGVKVLHFSPEDSAKFHLMMNKVHTEFAPKIGEAYLKKVYKLVDYKP